MNRLSRYLSVLCLHAVLPLAHAQTPATTEPTADVPVSVIFGEQRLGLDRIQAIANEMMSPQQAAALRAHGLSLHTMLFSFKFGLCHAEVGTAVRPVDSKSTRMPYWSAWAASEGKDSAIPAKACEKALRAAMKNLAGTEAFTDANLRKAVQVTSTPSKPAHPTGKREANTVNHSTWGLSDYGKQSIADTLGDRWILPLDHRRFSAFVYLREPKTLEGNSYCFLMTGLTAKPPLGDTSARIPAMLSSRAKVNEDCANAVVEAGLEQLRDTYEEDLDAFYKYNTEPGQTYPSAVEVRKTLAKYEADQKRKAQAAAASPARQSANTSRNVLRCTNDCVNGNCVRTFEDGRKERWQAPRRYNPLTSNWEWDITTNACGG
ncbi:MAG: hypothetical protein ACK44A_07635 [Roseateles sp.]